MSFSDPSPKRDDSEQVLLRKLLQIIQAQSDEGGGGFITQVQGDARYFQLDGSNTGIIAPGAGILRSVAGTAIGLEATTGSVYLTALSASGAVILQGGGGASGGVQIVMDATHDRGLAIGGIGPTQDWPIRARFDVNTQSYIAHRNATNGVSAVAGFYLENDVASANFSINATTHAVWPATTILYASTANGLALGTNTGKMEFYTADTLRLAISAAGAFNFTPPANTNISFTTSGTGQVFFANGSAANPSISFLSDTNTGFYWESADRLALTLGGVVRMFFDNSSIQAPNGAASSPSYRFSADGTKGMYHISAGVLGFATAGVLAMSIGATQNVTLTAAYIGSTSSLSGAGAIVLTSETTRWTSTGALQALTLADGVNGQHKYIVHVVDGGSGVLTPTTKTGFSTITFTDAGESVHLLFLTTQGWTVVGSYLAVIAP